MTSDLHRCHESGPSAGASADGRHDHDPERFPTELIPIVVPSLAVVLAMVVYFLMGEIL